MMDWSYKFEIEDNDEFEDELKDDNITTGVIFLIECFKNLFETEISGSHERSPRMSWFEAIIKSCLAVCKNKAMSSDRDHLSIVFYRVNSQSDMLLKNIYVFQNLNQPTVEDILKLMELNAISLENFDETYGFSENSNLLDALWCCQGLFSKCKTKFGSKEILLFTSDDDPYVGNENIKKTLIVKIQDLKKNNIHLEIFPVANSNFDSDKFYKRVFVSDTGDNDLDCVVISDPISKFDELMTRTRHKKHRKRTTNRISWFLGSDKLSISVGVYNTVMKSRASPYILLDSKTNMEVCKKRVKTLQESGQLLMPFDMKCCLTIGGKSICFERDEINKMRSILEPGIRLVGFKPIKYLKPYFHIRTSQFLYPDEAAIENSSSLFAAILKRTYERNLFALCVYVPRKSSPLQFVALVPQMEKLDSFNVQIQPQGFSVVFLPFEDDIRKLDLPLLSHKVKQEDIDMSTKLIISLSLDYDPRSILNPALQKTLSHIEALALNLDEPDKIDDNTVVNDDEINRNCGPILNQYKEHFNLNFQTPAPVKLKKSNENADLEELYKSNKLNSLTIPVLKEEANIRGIEIKGTRKCDIVKSICSYFESLN